MKKYLKRIIAVAISFLVFYQSGAMVNAGKEPTVSVEDMKARWYDTHYYPLYYGCEEWKNPYNDYKYTLMELIDILNPPEDLLISMPSQELAQLMQEHPTICRVMQLLGEGMIPDFEWLFLILERESEIFYELLRREDGIASILQAYKDNVYIELSYNQDSDIGKLWYAEMLGCHFILNYSSLFTESEYIMAKEILEEKSKRYYAELKDHQIEYMSLGDLTMEPPSGEPIKKIRTKYLDEDEIQEKEDRLEAARIKLDEIRRQEERERQKERAKEIRKFLVRCLIIGGTGIGVAGVVAGSVFIIRKRRRT